MGGKLSITAKQIVQLFKKDKEARRELAYLLVSDMEVRLVLTSAVLREVATKQDIAKLDEKIEKTALALKQDIAKLDEKIEKVAARLDEKMEKMTAKLDEKIDRLDRRMEERLRTEVDRLYRLLMISLLGILTAILTNILVRIVLP